MNAAVFIDVQNDFVTGALGSPWAQEVAPKIVEFAQNCRNRGFAMYATADTHEETELEGGKPMDGYLTTLEGRKLPVEHCLIGTKGHEIVKGLVKDGKGDVVIPQCNIFDKMTFGSDELLDKMAADFNDPILDEGYGYFGEPLDAIYICGFVTNICVVSNVLALRREFPNVKIILVENLCAGAGKDAEDAKKNHEAAIRIAKSCQIDIGTWKAGSLVVEGGN